MLIVILLLPLFTGCANTLGSSDDAWFGQDKALHFGCAAIIGTGGSLIAKHPYKASDTTATVIGFTCAMGMGTWKEWYDLRVKRTYWSWKDFFWDAIGAIAGSFAGTQAL